MAVASSGAGEEPGDGSEDLVRVGYQTLVESYGAYHSSDSSERADRRLRNFGQQLPAATAALQSLVAPLPAARGANGDIGGRPSHGDPGERRAQRGAKGGARRAEEAPAKRMIPVQRPLVKKGVPREEPRGPIPAPFASLGGAPDLEQQSAAAEVGGQPLEWRDYYRQCAEYFQQCEALCALQTGELGKVQPVCAALPAPAPSPTWPPADSTLPQAPAHAAPPGATALLPASPFGVGSTAAAAAVAVPQVGNVGLLGSLAVPYPQPHGQLHSLPTALYGRPLHASSPAGLQVPGFATPWPGSAAQAGGWSAAVAGPGLACGAMQPPGGFAAAGIRGLVASQGLDEPLANLLMAWYWSGYYTGQYAARQGK